jgi:hypothetical protein
MMYYAWCSEYTAATCTPVKPAVEKGFPGIVSVDWRLAKFQAQGPTREDALVALHEVCLAHSVVEELLAEEAPDA